MAQTRKQPSVSIVIPVFNEAEGLKACLDSIAAQTVMPEEVIVVDNNSTDGSGAVAAEYPFVTLLREKIQGTIAARDRGFNAVASDVIGRLDADCVLMPDWTEEVKRLFADPRIDGMSGLLETDVLPVQWQRRNKRTTFWFRMYVALSNAYFGVQMMPGGNMAIRAEAWRHIQPEAQTDFRAIHEDQDISILMASHGYNVVQSKSIVACLPSDNTSYHEWPKLKDYIRRWMRLKQYHLRAGTFERPTIAWIPVHKLLIVSTLMWMPFMVFAVSSLLLDSLEKWYDAGSA